MIVTEILIKCYPRLHRTRAMLRTGPPGIHTFLVAIQFESGQLDYIRSNIYCGTACAGVCPCLGMNWNLTAVLLFV